MTRRLLFHVTIYVMDDISYYDRPPVWGGCIVASPNTNTIALSLPC